MLNIGLAGCEQHWDLPLANDDRPQAICERREITRLKTAEVALRT